MTAAFFGGPWTAVAETLKSAGDCVVGKRVVTSDGHKGKITEGVPPTFHGGPVRFGDALPKTWSQSRRLLYTTESWEAKMEIPGLHEGNR